MVNIEALLALRQHMESLVEHDRSGGIMFAVPDRPELVGAGLDPEMVDTFLASSWLAEMTTDVIETPEYCEPNASADEILSCARDVVTEYFRKRWGH